MVRCFRQGFVRGEQYAVGLAYVIDGNPVLGSCESLFLQRLCLRGDIYARLFGQVSWAVQTC